MVRADRGKRRLGNRILWFALLWTAGVAVVTLVAYGIRWLIMP